MPLLRRMRQISQSWPSIHKQDKTVSAITCPFHTRRCHQPLHEVGHAYIIGVFWHEPLPTFQLLRQLRGCWLVIVTEDAIDQLPHAAACVETSTLLIAMVVLQYKLTLMGKNACVPICISHLVHGNCSPVCHVEVRMARIASQQRQR